jgi:hypothetical protein
MHNCKANRETLIAFALNPSDQTESLPAELETCATCREEYASLRSALRIVDQAKQNALPGESFWPGYQVRLRQHLETRSQPAAPVVVEPRINLGAQLRNLFLTSIRVPVPLAAALLIFFGASLFFALNSRRSVVAATPIVLTKTVEVPVPQETTRDRVVTRVVYRDRDRGPEVNAKVNATASRQPTTPAAEAPISLVGFKPTSEINLTVFKGSYRDDK